MNQNNEIITYEERSVGTKLLDHANRNPFLMAGFASLMAAVAVGAYKFKQRGSMPISLYLLQFRVIAQGSVIGCLTIGMAYHMFNEHVLHKEKKQ